MLAIHNHPIIVYPTQNLLSLFPSDVLLLYEASKLPLWLPFSQFLHLYSSRWLLLCISGYRQVTAKWASTETSFDNHTMCVCILNGFFMRHMSISFTTLLNLYFYFTVSLLCLMSLNTSSVASYTIVCQTCFNFLSWRFISDAIGRTHVDID